MQELPPLDAGYLYEVTEGVAEFRSERLRQRTDFPAGAPIRADNRSRLFTTWLREPVPLPEKRRGPALLVLHAGESLPAFPVPVQALDLRTAPADLAAAYAIFRRYLFDYRTDLATPFWMLIDAAGRVRRVYEDTPKRLRRQEPIGARSKQPCRMRAPCHSTASFSACPRATISRSAAPC